MNKQELDEASYLRSGRTAELIAKLQDQKESPPILVQSPPAQPAPAHKVYVVAVNMTQFKLLHDEAAKHGVVAKSVDTIDVLRGLRPPTLFVLPKAMDSLSRVDREQILNYCKGKGIKVRSLTQTSFERELQEMRDAPIKPT